MGHTAPAACAAQDTPTRAEAIPQRGDPRTDDARTGDAAQLALYGRPAPVRARVGRPLHQVPLCAGCRAKEARYGFRDEHDPVAARPRTLCFDCFRVEIGRRQAVAAQLRARAGRGWNARQAELPLRQTLEALTRRRRRAQIAARHALEL